MQKATNQAKNRAMNRALNLHVFQTTNWTSTCESSYKSS